MEINSDWTSWTVFSDARPIAKTATVRVSMISLHLFQGKFGVLYRYGRFFRMLFCGVIGLGLFHFCGCVTPHNSFERNRVSRDLEKRTGHPLLQTRSSVPMIPGSVVPEVGLSESDAVTLALWNNPAYEELLCDLGLSHADVLDAHQLKNPDVSVLFPLGPKQWEFAVNVPLDSIVLRSARLELAISRSQQVGNRVVQDSLNFVRDVRVAHSDLLLAQEQLDNAESRYQLLEKINKISESRWAAGTTGELDVMTTRIELQSAHERLERAGYDVQNAQDRLKTLMGLTFLDIIVVAVEKAQLIYVAANGEDLVTVALQSRPDIWAAQYAHQAASRQADLVKWDFISTTGIVSGKQNGQQIGPGLAMTLPVFHWNGASKYRAAEELKKTCYHWEALRQQVALDVRTTYTRMEQAEHSWNRWTNELIPAAEEAVRTSENAYRSGGDYLLLMLHHSRQLLDAELKKAEAAAELRKSIAELERSVGSVVVGPQEAIGF